MIIAAGAAIFYFTRRTNEDESAENGPSTDSTLTYYIDDGTPPHISESITQVLTNSGYHRIDTPEGAEVVIGHPPVDSDISDEAKAYPLNLYQVWGVTLPIWEEQNDSKIIIGHVSQLIDSDDPTELLREFYPISVSLETSAEGTAKLVTLSESLPSERFAAIPGHGSPIEPENRDVTNYPLVFHVTIQKTDNNYDIFLKNDNFASFMSEYDYRTSLPDVNSVTTVIKTGTSVTGGPGWELCERVKGDMAYPIEEVKNLLAGTDLALISNETSFVDGCTQPAGATSFCGKPGYLQNILDMGIDIISLTGNHMCDYGKNSFTDMLSTYSDNDLRYFGAGTNEDAAWEPLYVETGAGTIAFIGYNMMGPAGVIADGDSAGSAYYDKEKFTSAMKSAQTKADILWVDTHLWPEYGTVPSEDQVELSREAVDLGADIVTGVSSHEIQGMTFYKDTPVFYGLGNFLFDQMWSPETRQGIVLEIKLFEGKIVNIDILPTRMYDYCQPRFLEGDDAQGLRDYFFSISDI